MSITQTTGVIFCYESDKKKCRIDYETLRDYVSTIPGVVSTWFSTELDAANPQLFAEHISAADVSRVILAGERPGRLKSFVSNALVHAGRESAPVVLADFRERTVNGTDPTGEAKGVLYAALYDVPYDFAAVPSMEDVLEDTLVIGGGIAGIQAALEIADAGLKVYLVEKSGTIGGHMAMFDKTFPTLDCAACILTPKMVEVGQHPNIEMLTYSQVEKVDGQPGTYAVSVRKKARRVNLASCIGCGTCAEKCPSKVPAEFDAYTSLRKAIYIPFPQAVPNKYLIDEAHCRYVTEGKCGVCVKVCPVDNCINLDEQDEVVTLKVGNIIVATGFRTLDPEPLEQYGYGKLPNVVTSLEFERLVNASGPTGGQITCRTQDKKGHWVFTPDASVPESFALIHCVGSRNINYHKYCSRVCCMYSLKLAHLLREKFPEAPITEYYIDMRAFGKQYDEFYERIRSENIHMVRGRTAKIEGRNGKLQIRSEDILHDALIEDEVDMVILAVGLESTPETRKLAGMLNIQMDEHGWLTEAHDNAEPVLSTEESGIHIAGLCQGPKDIPDTVAQASAAAARVLQSILRKKVRHNPRKVPLESIEDKVNELSTLKE